KRKSKVAQRDNLLIKVAAWRASKKTTRSRIPDCLWLEILNLLNHYSIKEICRDFNLRPGNVEKAKEKLENPYSKKESIKTPSFVDISELLSPENERYEIEMKLHSKSLTFSSSSSGLESLLPRLLTWMNEQ
ncbi:hypothetical protein MJH12_00250, partial [bacterium]|nr:hypothetical protein [bacterium]